MRFDRKAAQAAGYYVRRGAYAGTPDDRLDRWYIGHEDEPFRPWGKGYRTARDAWAAAVDLGPPEK
jgi:hypothetical protein